ncbi:hypothetical protein [Streptomyces cupreus]|uniref:Uncharacterized protein n=1 Tax=Streptomyces cupreus TaxID=2759956 RepID=A0A7X1MB16_9ACTN|nr:hypothetical protein [Streptomyces cupreus]MBC2904929.1 hypothetical protein [Streptomyces cupreus]
MSHRDDINATPSPTELKQAELREELGLSEDLSELHPNAAALARNVLLRRDIEETDHLLTIVRHAKGAEHAHTPAE